FSDVNRGNGDGVPLGEPIDFGDHGLGSGGGHAIRTGPGVLHQTCHICKRAQRGSERLRAPLEKFELDRPGATEPALEVLRRVDLYDSALVNHRNTVAEVLSL